MTRSRAYLPLIIVALWAVIYIPSMFSPALLDDADSVHAEAAREMVVSGDWVTLHVDGIRYLEKAPLLYWTMALSFRLFGVSEWSARLPLTIFALALAFAVYFVGKLATHALAGFYASLVVLTAFGDYIFTRILIPDLIVGFWYLLTLVFFQLAVRGKNRTRYSVLLGIVVALNVLTKGLIGIVFPAVAILGYLLWIGKLRDIALVRWLSAIGAFIIVAAPWHLLAALRNPAQGGVRGWAWFYFINEHFLRYIGRRVPVDYDKVPLWLFWGLVLVWLLPWTFSFFPMFHPLRLFDLVCTREHDWRLLYFIGGFTVLVFFSFSTRQEYYVLPALPLFALLIGESLAEDDLYSGPANQRFAKGALIGLAGIGAAVLIYALTLHRPAVDLAQLLTKNPEMYALSFGHFFDLTHGALAIFKSELVVTGAVLMLCPLAIYPLRERGRFLASNLVIAAGAAAFLLAAHSALNRFQPVLSSRDIAREVGKLDRAGAHVVINGEYESGSTLNFYTGRQVEILNGRSANLWYGSQFPDAPQIFYDDVSFRALWEEKRVYLFTPVDQIPPYLRGRSDVHRIFESGGKVLLSNFNPVSSVAERDSK